MKLIQTMVNWNDDSARLLARAMLVILLLASFTPFSVFSEGQQYITHSHDESSHHHHIPQPGGDASASTPVTLKEPATLLVGDGYLLAPPQNPVLSLDHPPE